MLHLTRLVLLEAVIDKLQSAHAELDELGMHLILLQLAIQVGVHVLQQFNGLIDNVLRSHQHSLPQVLNAHQVHSLRDKTTPVGQQSALVDVYHPEEAVKAPASERKGNGPILRWQLIQPSTIT